MDPDEREFDERIWSVPLLARLLLHLPTTAPHLGLMVMEMLSAHCCEVNFNELLPSLEGLERQQQESLFSLGVSMPMPSDVDFEKIETIIRYIFFCVGSNLSGTILGRKTMSARIETVPRGQPI